LKHIQSKTGNN